MLKAPTVGESGYTWFDRLTMSLSKGGFPIKTSGMTNKDFYKKLDKEKFLLRRNIGLRRLEEQ